MNKYFKNVNLWNVLFALLAVWVFISGYTQGLWNAINCVIMILSFFLLGRASLDRELEINLDKAKETIKRRTK